MTFRWSPPPEPPRLVRLGGSAGVDGVGNPLHRQPQGAGKGDDRPPVGAGANPLPEAQKRPGTDAGAGREGGEVSPGGDAGKQVV